MKDILTLRSVSRSFGGVHAVRSCSFGVREGTVTAVIGANGAGKTTLFNVINGFISADEGRIFLNDVDIVSFPVWKRSQMGLSRTFQIPRLFDNLSLGENMALALREDDHFFWRSFLRREQPGLYDSAIREWFTFVGLHKKLDGMPDALSYGERKLFDLARSLANPHTILLLDEPVAGVNPVLRDVFHDIMKKLEERNETVVLIEHDIDFVRKTADRVVAMDQGSVLCEGDPEEVLRDRKVLDAYLGTR